MEPENRRAAGPCHLSTQRTGPLSDMTLAKIRAAGLAHGHPRSRLSERARRHYDRSTAATVLGVSDTMGSFACLQEEAPRKS